MHPCTTKKEIQEHGIGLQSVKKVVDSYNGEMKISDENNLFDVSPFLLVILLFVCSCIIGCRQINFFQYHTSVYDNKEKLTLNKSSYSYWNKEGVVDKEHAKITFSFSGMIFYGK